eukprot:TRINITY_DN23608_c0_g1_i2.p1 TRINITY_DN23608_c0_g1~~TRINITY_DN23608_c0_g1_i2.p1  ORF type:complete len:620 (+),score=123.57 TRINITY_DN23608_c0_g1_i2:31-1860(+)
MAAVNVSVETLRLELQAFASGTLRTELEEALQALWKPQDASQGQSARQTLTSRTELEQQRFTLPPSKDKLAKGSIFLPDDGEAKSPAPLRIGGSINDGDASEAQAETPNAGQDSAAEAAPKKRLSQQSHHSFALEPLVPYEMSEPQEWVSRHPFLCSTTKITTRITGSSNRGPQKPKSRNWFDETMKLQMGPEVSMAARRSPGETESRSPGIRVRLQNIVYSTCFEYIALAIILLNVIIIGWETQLKVSQKTNNLPDGFVVVDVVLMIFFAVEILLKVAVDYRMYFLGPGCMFNWLDTIIVLCEICMNASHGLRNLRLLRTINLIRIMRSARLIRCVESVRAIVLSIGICFRPFLGGIVVLTFLIYSMAVFFMESVLSTRLTSSPQALDKHYSNLFTCMFHLFQALTGGIDWNEMVVPMMEHVTPLLGLVYALYVMFSLLAVMNVITGIFVSTAMKAAKDDQDKIGIAFLEELFDKMDERKTGKVGWDDFQKHLNTMHMQELFKSIDLDPSEADCVFKLLDLDGSGELQFSEFLNGCLRLRGPAKALDVLLLLRETTQQFQRQTELVQKSKRVQEQQEQRFAELLQGLVPSTAPTSKRKSRASKAARAE